MTEQARLKWQCRRGMRELDLILETFLEHRYETLTPASRAGFARLLGCPNVDLVAWLIEGSSPQDKQLEIIVRQIRDEGIRDD